MKCPTCGNAKAIINNTDATHTAVLEKKDTPDLEGILMWLGGQGRMKYVSVAKREILKIMKPK